MKKMYNVKRLSLIAVVFMMIFVAFSSIDFINPAKAAASESEGAAADGGSDGPDSAPSTPADPVDPVDPADPPPPESECCYRYIDGEWVYQCPEDIIVDDDVVDDDDEPDNLPPVADDDSATVVEDTASNQINVLNGDSDPDGDSITISSVGSASFGTTSRDNEYVYYTPNANYFGPDQFTYTIFDGNGGQDTGTVSVEVLALDNCEFMADEGPISFTSVSALDSSHFIVAYRSDDVYVRVGTIEGDGSISFGDRKSISGDYYWSFVNKGPRVTALDGSHFVVEFGSKQVSGSNSAIACRAGTINGDGSISLGDIEVLGSTNNPSLSLGIKVGDIRKLDSSHFAVTYNIEMRTTGCCPITEFNRWSVYYRVGEVSGNNIDMKAAESISEVGDAAEIAPLDSTRFVASYKLSGSLYSRVYTFTGSDLNEGSAYLCGASSSVSDLATLDSSHFAMEHGTSAQVPSVSGEIISYETPDSCSADALANLDSTHFAAVSGGVARIASISGSSITLGSPMQFNTGDTSYVSTDGLDSSRFVVAYSEEGVLMVAVLPCSGGNNPPNTPSQPTGPTDLKVDESGTYSTSTTDPDGDDIDYIFRWGDGTDSGWIGPYNSGQTISLSNSWSTAGTYNIDVRARDENGANSGWSPDLTVIVTDNNPPPEEPSKPEIQGNVMICYTEIEYTFNSDVNNPGSNTKYYFHWDDRVEIPEPDQWNVVINPPPNPLTLTEKQTWNKAGVYDVKVYIITDDPITGLPTNLESVPFPVQVTHKSENPEDG